MDSYDLRLVRGGAICGLLGTLIYIGLALTSSEHKTPELLREMGTQPHAIWGHFGVAFAAMLWLVSFIGLERLLSKGRFPNAARLGMVFGIVACGVLVAMLIAQGSVMTSMGKMYVAATSDADRQAIVTVYRGLRAVDQGLDLAFDSFFFTGWLCFAVAMFASRYFSKVLVVLLAAVFVADTPLQLYYAPTPPAFDVGPFGSLLFIGIYVQMLLAARTRTVQPVVLAAAS